MKNKILLTYIAIGPTYRDRLLLNITSTPESYKLVDLLILTDIVDDFNILSEYSNIKVQNLDDLRQNHPWSFKYESLPLATKDETKYVDDIIKNQKFFPGTVWRFALLIKGIEDYKAIFFANCDVLFKLTKEYYDIFIKSLEFDTEDNVIGNGAVNYSSTFNNLTELYSKQNNISYQENLIESNDGNLFGYCFKDKNKYKRLFEIIDDIIYQTLVKKDINYFQLGQHGIWSTNNEPIQAISYSLLNINTYPGSEELYLAFSINTYPEDRFWSWGSNDLITSNISKQDFINKNYNYFKKLNKHE